MAKRKHKQPRRVRTKQTHNRSDARPQYASYEDWMPDMPEWLYPVRQFVDTGNITRARERLMELFTEKTLQEKVEVCTEEITFYIYFEVSILCFLSGLLEQALEYSYKALKIRDAGGIYNQIGLIYRRMNNYRLAIENLQKAKELSPGVLNIWNNLAMCLMKVGWAEDAIDIYRRGVEKEPCHKSVGSNLLFHLNYMSNVDISEMHEKAINWARHQAPLSLAWTDHDNLPDPHRKLRIGYMSPDFRTHSVMYFFDTLLMGHDRQRFELYGYGNVEAIDHVTEATAKLFDRYHNLKGMGDKEIAELIRSDQVDILVDLAGHTKGHNLHAMAYKPAPIQVTYLGYPMTTGMSQIDYRFTDAIADTPDQQQYYSEKLVYLPHGFLCYNPGDVRHAIEKTPFMTEGHITFGCSNNINKVNPGMIKLWTRILNAVPGSKMILKFAEAKDPSVKQYYYDLFEQHGLKDAKDRIALLTWLPYTRHMQLYNYVDIALDTYPYNGTTTTCQALYMGVPVITQYGSHHASRVGLDVLSRLDLQFFAAGTPEEYFQKAVALASKPEALANIRANMRQRLSASPLCNYKLIAHDIETAYRQMWHTWCQQQGVEVTAAESQSDASLNIPIPDSETPVAVSETDNDTPGNDSESYVKIETMQPQNDPVGEDSVSCSPLRSAQTAAAVKTTTRKLHIGGKVSHPEWELLNIQAGPNVDHIGDAKDLSQFEDETFDALYASHVVEHFDYIGPLQATLQEWRRVLKPGGQLYISVPDMDTLCRLFLDARQSNPQQCYHIMRMMFGGHVDPYDYHYVGLNFGLLSAFLKLAKFRDFKRVKTFGIFEDTSNFHYAGAPVSLNVIASK